MLIFRHEDCPKHLEEDNFIMEYPQDSAVVDAIISQNIVHITYDVNDDKTEIKTYITYIKKLEYDQDLDTAVMILDGCNDKPILSQCIIHNY